MVSPSIIPLKPFAGLRTEYSIEQLGRLYDQFFTPHKLSYMHHDVVGGDALKLVYSDTAERKQFQTASIVQGVEFSDLLAEWQELKSVLRVCTSMTTLHDVLMYVELNEEGDTEYPQMRTLLRLLFTLPVGTNTATLCFRVSRNVSFSPVVSHERP